MTEKEKRNENPLEGRITDNSKEKDNDIYATTEIKIEEMAIDGICGVY